MCNLTRFIATCNLQRATRNWAKRGAGASYLLELADIPVKCWSLLVAGRGTILSSVVVWVVVLLILILILILTRWW